MTSRFEQWKKENRLIEADEAPTSEAPPSESMGAIRTKIDTMLKVTFDQMKNRLLTTFGKDIRGLTDDAKRQAMEYLKKAYINLGGQITTIPPKTPTSTTQTESYYNAAFNKLDRMFHEVAEEVGSANDNKRRVLGLTDFLDTARTRIMDMIDKMLIAAKHDHLYQGIQGLGNKLDAQHKSSQDLTRSVKAHISDKLNKHAPIPEKTKKYKTMEDMVKDGGIRYGTNEK